MRALPDVAAAVGGVAGQAQLIGTNGKAIRSAARQPRVLASIADQRVNPLTLIAGRWPKRTARWWIDRATAGRRHNQVGDTIGVPARAGGRRLRVAGLAEPGAVSSIGGATIAGFDVPTAQRLFEKQGKLDTIRDRSEAGNVTDAELVRQIRPDPPRRLRRCKSGTEQANEDTKDVNSFIGRPAEGTAARSAGSRSSSAPT